MKLYIAEKPSLGRAIADVLPKPHKKQQGYIEVANGDVVTWCIGHILEQAEPDDYDPKYKKWQLNHLPIVPEQWQLKPKYKTRSQLTAIRKLAKSASQIIHAGDPDREGQLLVDEVLNYIKLPATKKSQTQRLLISDLNPASVKRALNQLRSNQEFMPLSVSALARSRADWLYGMNLTRSYTIHGQQQGYKGVLSVGRVQTPVLGLVVKRDLEIENFVPHPFYQVFAYISDAQGGSIPQPLQAKWQPSDACQPHMDSEGRIINKALAEHVANTVAQKPAKVASFKQEKKSQVAPLPYNLSALQMDANKAFGMNAKRVLDTAQALYEKHKLITYPRSDCRYLPNDHQAQAASIIGHLQQSQLDIAKHLTGVSTSGKFRVFNDSKVSAHHAIVPTEKPSGRISLSGEELKIYSLIARNYAAQFLPKYEYEECKISFDIEGGTFTSNLKRDLNLGWKRLFPSSKQDAPSAEFPNLQQGQMLFCERSEVKEKMTEAPSHFTDATLLAAMTGISRFVTDKEIKKILKETDGLGTEATRAGIIELLVKRNFIQRHGKTIKATDVGKALVKSLPDKTVSPDMTALWEYKLNAISEKQGRYSDFMAELNDSIEQLLQQATGQNFSALKQAAVNAPTKSFYKKKKWSKSKTATAKKKPSKA